MKVFRSTLMGIAMMSDFVVCNSKILRTFVANISNNEKV